MFCVSQFRTRVGLEIYILELGLASAGSYPVYLYGPNTQRGARSWVGQAKMRRHEKTRRIRNGIATCTPLIKTIVGNLASRDPFWISPPHGFVPEALVIADKLEEYSSIIAGLYLSVGGAEDTGMLSSFEQHFRSAGSV